MSDQSSRWDRASATAGEEKPRFQARQNTEAHLAAEEEEADVIVRDAPPIVHWLWLFGVLALAGLAVVLARLVLSS